MSFASLQKFRDFFFFSEKNTRLLFVAVERPIFLQLLLTT